MCWIVTLSAFLRNTVLRRIADMTLTSYVQVLRMVEDEEGEATMARKLPSSSACKAFNQEDEEDEFDRLACESLQRLRCRPKPALKTQVRSEVAYCRICMPLE